MIQTWFKLFFRNSKKNWISTFINISGLTLGLTGLIIVLLYYNKENAYDKWNPNKNDIYKVGHAFSDGQLFDDSTQPEGPKSTEVIPEITDFFTMPSWYNNDLLVVGDKTIYTKKIVFGDSNFFSFFPHPILEGNINTFLKAKDAVVISKEIKEQLFGNNKGLGKSIKIGAKKYIVTGVYKLEKPSTIEPDIVINKKINTNLSNHWGAFSNHTYYKVKKGTNLTELENKLHQVFIDNFYKKEASQNGIPLDTYIEQQGSKPFLEQLNGFRLHSRGDLGPLEGKGNYLFLMIMLGLSILIIIISSINFINLSIAAGSQRAKEIGIKKTLGISENMLKVHFTFEVIFQCVIAFVFALLITELILPLFNNYFNTTISLSDQKLLFQVSILTFLIAVLIGVLFAVYMSKFKTILVLKGDFSRNNNMVFIRNLMLGLQFVISGFFLIGGYVVYHQVKYMSTKELGFSGDQILVVDFSNDVNKWDRYELTKKVFKSNPNIINVSTSLETPGVDEDFSQDLVYKEKRIDTKFIPVDFGHFEMIKAKMKLGRTFSEKFSSDSISGMIINETAALRLGLKNPIHKTIKAFGKDFKIIGMVKDYHVNGFDKKIRPIFYLHFNSISWLKYNLRAVHFKLKKSNMNKAITEIEQFWNTELEPGYPFSSYFVNQKFAKTYEKYNHQQTLFTILTSIVIFIALLGLFALSSLTIQQRLKEVAIRKALGSSVKEIMFQLLKDFLKIVVISSLMLFPIAYYFMQIWLENFIYRIEIPMLPFIVTPIILMLLVFVVVGLKAYNATKVDLIKYLKFE
mgnify:CR=1 FL=1